VTHAGFPPVMVEALLDQEELGRCEELREVISGGEAIPADLPARFAARLPSAALLNRYGPTEATVAVTSWTFGRRAAGRRLPIGRPIAGADLHVVDARLRTQPIGVPGELLIGGHTLARGYLRRPALTAERFVPHPAAGEPGRRAYRTGDRVRQRPDGVFEFLGRIDRQVKIRGFRVELGEVESALRRLPSVDEVAVVDVAEGPTRRLVAYLVPAKDAEPRPAELAAALGETLPDYMVPSAFVPLDELPRTPTGKVDRDRLPAAEGVVAPERERVSPRNPLELELARIFEEVLGRGSVGVTDSFFELGGHSLLAIRLAAAVRDRLGRELPIADFFQGPTVEELASRLRGESEGTVPSALVPLQPAGDRPPFFCVHPVAGNALSYRELARELGPEQPFWGLQTPALTPGVEPLETVEEMAEAYLEEIRRMQPEGPYRLGGWSFGGLVAYEMARRLEAAGEEVALVALLDTVVPDAGAAPTPAAPGTRDHDREVSRALDVFAHLFRFPTDEVEELLASLAPEERLAALVDHFQKSGHLPPDLTLDTLRHHLAVEEVIRQANYAYRPRPYGGKVTVFRAQDGPAGDPGDPTAGWSGLAAEVESVAVPGRHQVMVFQPHVVELAKALARYLE
jgi:thioesterase domain-containing protein/acyl carrier protein